MRVSKFFAVSILLLALIGCGGPPQSTGTPGEGTPELTKAVIDERINDAYVSNVGPENGQGPPTGWSFDEDEPKEITVVEQKIDGNKATIILDIKTRSAPYAKNLRVLEGKIRTEWELQRGLVLRRWEIVETENISMKYKDMPKPSPSATDSPAR